MNITLWVLQILLALWNITGALYMASHHDDLSSMWALQSLPAICWVVIAIIQILLALGLVLSGIFTVSKQVTVISALGLTVLSLLGLVLYSSYAGFPGMLWGIIPAILLLFIAYKRK